MRPDYRAERIRGFGTSVFSEMSRLAREHGAVNLGQGFPDFPGPDFVKEAAKAAIDADFNQYAISHGAPRLRSAVAQTWTNGFGGDVDPEREITVTSGATEAIYDAIQAFTGPGDEIVVFEPFYDSYLPSATMAGARRRAIRLQPPDWTFDRDQARAAFGPKTRMLLLNSPHNPTGKVFSRVELEFLADLCRHWDMVAICDEVYDRIIFDEVTHIPLATLPGMWERTLAINSTGKTVSMTGWKVGYAVGGVHLNEGLRAVHQFVTFATSTPFQEAMADAFAEAESRNYYADLQRDYTMRRSLLANALHEAGLPTLPVQGAYFLMADVSETDFADDVAFCRWLTSEIGVAAVPPSAFYLDPSEAPLLARFCFAKAPETTEQAAQRLRLLPERRALRKVML